MAIHHHQNLGFNQTLTRADEFFKHILMLPMNMFVTDEDFIISVLYENVISYKNKNPKYKKRDRFVLSKGHAGAAVYAVLAGVF